MPGGGHRYPVEARQADAGTTLPIARVPPTDRYKSGDENVHAGRGTFYKLRYGPYVIAMNCPKDRNFPLAPPVGEGPLQALTGGKAPVKAGSTVVVGPGATAVYYVGP